MISLIKKKFSLFSSFKMMRGFVIFVTIFAIILPQIANGFILQDQDETTPEKTERAVEKEKHVDNVLEQTKPQN